MRSMWMWLLTAWMTLFFAGCSTVRRVSAPLDALSPAEHTKLGESYFSQGDVRMAEEQYKVANKQDPRYVPAILALGNLEFIRGNSKKARKYFTHAVELAPDDPASNNNLSMVDLADMHDLEAARKRVERVMPLNGPMRPYLMDTLEKIKLMEQTRRDYGLPH